MNAIQFIKDHGVERAREVVEGAPSNAESYQDGYYFRTKPEFQFHNGFHPVWNLTDNNGEYFKKQGFNPVDLEDLKRLVESVDLVKGYVNRESGKWFFIADYCKKNKISPFLSSNYEAASNLFEQAIADYEAIGGEHV